MTSRKPFRRSGDAGATRACATTVKRRQRKKERNIFAWMWLRYGRISLRHVMACKIAAVIKTGYQPDAVEKNTLSWLNSRICFGWILFTVCLWGIPTHRYKKERCWRVWVQCNKVLTLQRYKTNICSCLQSTNSEYIFFSFGSHSKSKPVSQPWSILYYYLHEAPHISLKLISRTSLSNNFYSSLGC